MSMDSPWVPDTKEEDRLMEDLHLASRRAHADGISKQRIASIMAFMAAASLEEAPRPEEEASPPVDEEATDEAPTCPECGEVIENLVKSMGQVNPQPCGCTFDFEEAREKFPGLMEDGDEA